MLSDNIRNYRKINNMSQDELAEKLAKQVYMLALVAQRPLEADELSEFLALSSELYTRL